MLVAQRTLIDAHATDLAALLPGAVELRELRDVVLERPVAPGDTLHVSVTVDDAAPVADGSRLLSTSWRLVNGAGETVARAHADVVCRGSHESAASALAEALDDMDIGQIPV